MKYSEFQNKLDLSAPINVNIEVTNKCNLQCIFCSANSNNIKNNGELSISDLMNLADELRELKVFRVKITGGEPFIKKDIMEFFVKLSKHHRISINTNGTLITEKIARELSQLNIDTVIVSLDSSSEEINNRMRGRNSFGKIVDGIKILKKFNVPVNIATVLTKLNVNEIPELAQFVKELGFSQIGVNHIYPKGRANSLYKKLSLDYDELESFNLKVNEFNRINKNILVSFEQAHWYEMKKSFKKLKLPIDIDNGKKNYLLPCHAGINQIGVLSNGDVVPCLLSDGFVFGNIKKDKIADIWKNSPVFMKMKELATTEIQEIECCANCKLSYNCYGGCRAKAYLNSGNLLGKDPECPHMKIDKFG